MGHSQEFYSPASVLPPADLVKREIQSNDSRDPEKVEQVEKLRLEDHENPLNWKNGRKCNIPSLYDENHRWS